MAQELTVLPKDETGKFTYYEVVNSSVNKDSLSARVVDFLASNRKEIKPVATGSKQAITANGKLIIRKSVTLLSHPSGEVTYQFNFETTEGKYRFWLTDFQFIPYQKDRYGNFVPSTTIGIPLEKEPKKANAEQWEDYRLQATTYAVNFAKRFKDHLVKKPILPLPPPEKKVIAKEW